MWEKKHLNGISLPSNGIARSPQEAFKARYITVVTKALSLYGKFDLSSLFPNGALLLLTWSCILHVFGYYPLIFYLRLTFKLAPNMNMYLGVFRASLFLLYPLFNYLGECCWSRYKIMFWGTVLALVGVFISGPFVTLIFRRCLTNLFSDRSCHVNHYIVAISFTGLLVYYIGVSLFEANSLPFGISQLQSNSKEKVRTLLTFYVWVIHVSEYGGLPLIYLLVRVGSVYWCACFLLLPVFVLFVCSREYRRHLVSEPLNRLSTPCKLLKIYVTNLVRHFGSLTNHHGESEETNVYNRMFTLFLTLLGFFMMQSSCLPKNISFDFDDDWLIGNRFCYLFANEILQAIPIFTLIIFTLSGKKNFLARMKPLRKIKYGVILSLLVLLISMGCSWELKTAYNFNRSLFPLLSIIILVSSLLKGMANLLTVVAVFELIFLYAPHQIQGSLLALWNCYRLFPLSSIAATGIRSNELLFNFLPLCLETVVALVATIGFLLLHRKLTFQRPQSRSLDKNNNKKYLHV